MTKWQQIERLLDSAAAAWMAASVGIALALAAPQLGAKGTISLILAGFATAWLITYRLLAVMRGPSLRLPRFDLAALDQVEPEQGNDGSELQLTAAMSVPALELLLTADMAVLTSELLLTRGQMLNPPPVEEGDLLLLDDVLAQLQPDSRVVQLFDPARIPTAGELQSRIDLHLGKAARIAPDEGQPDASQALYDALADLRRSLA